MIVLGIDPGTARCGYGLIEAKKNKLKYIECGCIETDKNQSASERLTDIYYDLTKIIKKFQPDILASEKIFVFKNLKTAIKIGQAQGIILLVAHQNKLSVEEFTPLQIKQALTGYGRADKVQIQKMVKNILHLNQIPRPDDAADGLACAICAANNRNFKS
jgi:crossover junction endodeoxyribonuclease RuvC